MVYSGVEYERVSASNGASVSEKAVPMVISRLDEFEARKVRFSLSFRHQRMLCCREHGCHTVSSTS